MAPRYNPRFRLAGKRYAQDFQPTFPSLDVWAIRTGRAESALPRLLAVLGLDA